MSYPGAVPPWPGPPPPAPSGAAERAYRWFVVYAVAMAVLYLLLIVIGLVLALVDLGLTDAEGDATSLRLQGVFLAFPSVGMFLLFAAAPFLPRKPWVWIYGLVVIGLGLSSCCTWPATIPLMIQWLKPEMKARFGRT